MNEFRDKVAVITGAASGIGRGIAEKFLQENMRVVLSDIETESLSQTEKELKEIGSEVLSVVADVSKIEDVEKLAQTTIDNFSAVHIMCNNAGVGFAGKTSTTIWESALSEWKWIFNVNIWGVIHGVHVFVPIMLNQNSDCYIINTGSIAGLIIPPIGGGIYSITKHAVIALSEALKYELDFIGANVKVLTLCPGFILTKLGESERNRPQELYDEINPNPKLEPLKKAYQQSMATGISPKKVAEILYEALKDEKFYVPTDHHRFLRSNVKKRMEGILQDLQK